MDFAAILINLVQNYGVAGLFVAAAVANASLFFVVPVDILVFALGTTANPFAIALIGGLGAALGEMTSYIVGLGGRGALKRFGPDIYKKIMDATEKLQERNGLLLIYFTAMIPFPFDIIGIAAGMTHFNVFKFFMACYAGKATRYLFLALAGYYGFQAVRTFFGF